MVVTSSTATATASAILTLSKTAWKLGGSLSKLDQDHKTADITVKDLAAEVKSLSNECDLVYAELEEVISKSETGSPPSFDVGDRIWNVLATQVDEIGRTMQELELFVRSIKSTESNSISQTQRQRERDESKDETASIRAKVCWHTDTLQTTLLLINMVVGHIAPSRADQELANEVDKLQDMVEKLQRSLETNQQSSPSHTEASLTQCAHEVIMEVTTMDETTLAAESVTGGQGAVNSNVFVAEWVSTLESIRQGQRFSGSLGIVSNVASVFSGDKTRTVVTSATSRQYDVQENEAFSAVNDDSDDDLDTDLAKAALGTGIKAFEAQDWEEADSLLQEALKILQQLPKQQLAFCDIFGLQYRLAVCAYHLQEPPDAEGALMSLVQQPASSDEQRRHICSVTHLLSLLYVRMGQVNRARSECEKTLQARRRLLGKRSDASLESTALMAQIYFLLNNYARAKSYLAMIPEDRRGAILKTIEESLGTKVKLLDSLSLLTPTNSEGSDLIAMRNQSRLSISSVARSMKNHWYKPTSAMISRSPATSLRQPHQRIPFNRTDLEAMQSVTVPSLSLAEERSGSRAREIQKVNDYYSTDPEVVDTAALSPGEPPEANKTFKGKALSRKEILDKIGCQPKDRIENAVCDGDHSVLANLLNRKNDFWQSKLRKRVRPERVTALHFAALFGEVDMARCLLGSNFNINQVPYGYTKSLTPLNFAIGAREADMIEFLIENGAKPSEPDSWSTLAGQLMNRSWLMKTVLDSGKEYVPNQIVAILEILLKYGWDVNAPFATSGETVLHQAVSFWTGSYRWDLNLRAVVTSFLCERGADPFQANSEGKTPYDMALASGHQDLLLVLNQVWRNKGIDGRPLVPVELSG